MSAAPSVDPDAIRWRVHLASGRERVFAMLATAGGRRQFWAESAEEEDGVIRFRFPGGAELDAPILELVPPERFAIRYFDGSRAQFTCHDDGGGGTDLEVTETGVKAETRPDNLAGWVSVLLALKAAVDHGVDLRNHDERRTWAEGYADN